MMCMFTQFNSSYTIRNLFEHLCVSMLQVNTGICRHLHKLSSQRTQNKLVVFISGDTVLIDLKQIDPTDFIYVTLRKFIACFFIYVTGFIYR